MNILIYSVRLDTGGISSVSVFLANSWKNAGHRVAIACFEEITEDVKGRLEKSIPIYRFGQYKYNKENVAKLREILLKEKIGVVVNQFGLPWIPMKTILKARKGLDIKIVSCYHSAPNSNGRLTAIDKKLERTTNYLKRKGLYLEKKLVSFVTSRSMRYVFNKSDAYVLLSSSFFSKFLNYTGLKHTSKLYAISNPVTLEKIPTFVDTISKEKILLYVGRVETLVKRVDRVIEVWRLLEPHFPNWKLQIVGDGEGLRDIKALVDKYNLKRVVLEGFQSPIPYYEKASVILLTSDFEGFGLVLVEGMTYGVVPVAYGSYDSVFDIIKDGYNGYVVMPEAGLFPVKSMAEKIGQIMGNSQLREQMSINSFQYSKRFSEQEILAKWDALFKGLYE